MRNGSVFTAVAFLEAVINEIFLDAFNKVKHGEITKLQPDTVELLANMWAHGNIDRLPILNKYQVALASAGKQIFDSGRLPYQEVDSLIKLRSALVHYKPKTVTFVSDVEAEPVTRTYLEKRLRGKFTLNPLVSEANPFFPDRCLSHGCADWAVVSSLEFTDQFFLRMGLTPTYEHVRSRLNTN